MKSYALDAWMARILCSTLASIAHRRTAPHGVLQYGTRYRHGPQTAARIPHPSPHAAASLLRPPPRATDVSAGHSHFSWRGRPATAATRTVVHSARATTAPDRHLCWSGAVSGAWRVMDSNQLGLRRRFYRPGTTPPLTCTNVGRPGVPPGTCHGQLATAVDVRSPLDTASWTADPASATRRPEGAVRRAARRPPSRRRPPTRSAPPPSVVARPPWRAQRDRPDGTPQPAARHE
jgi:hypothetical protein